MYKSSAGLLSLITVYCCLSKILKMMQTTRFSGLIRRGIVGSAARLNNQIDVEGNEPMIPPYEEKFGEPLDLKKARLLYQSRKRGMLENGLLLSTFAAKYLKTFDEQQTREYDRLINLPSNDWDIFYWATGVKPTPEEFNTGIMNLFKEFIKNNDREMRIRQPDLEAV